MIGPRRRTQRSAASSLDLVLMREAHEALGERSAALARGLFERHRANERADCAGDYRPANVKSPVERGAGERQDHLGRDRRKHRLGDHQQREPEVAQVAEHLRDGDAEDSLGTEASVAGSVGGREERAGG